MKKTKLVIVPQKQKIFKKKHPDQKIPDPYPRKKRKEKELDATNISVIIDKVCLEKSQLNQS